MNWAEEGSSVRIDIPDQSDPDYERLHNRFGEIVEIIEDDADRSTGDERDSVLYRVRLKNGELVDMRWRDLRPE